MNEIPGWFERAIAAPFTEHWVDAGGCSIHYIRWAPPASSSANPSVILIHGGGAHAFWWGYLGPLLADTHDVIALDLSGHGDSGRRESYPREVWADDVLAVMEHARLASPPVLVGHSMGGFVSMVMASLHGDRLGGAIVIDSPVGPPAAQRAPDTAPAERAAPGGLIQKTKTHPDVATAVARFRPVPDQPTPYTFLLEYVATRSVRADPDGVVWKFDPRVFGRDSRSSLRAYLASARCRMALIRGELSVVVSREMVAYMAGLIPSPVPVIEVPEGHHHLMFDQPLPLVVALRSLLADWRCTTLNRA